MPRVLFVCTGNTCRSPMAEYWFEFLKKKYNLDDWQAISAGLSAYSGGQGQDRMIKVMSEVNIDTEGHRCQPADEKLINRVNLIITMTDSQRDILKEKWGPEKNYIYSFNELTGAEISNIRDPWGQSLETYRSTRDQLKQAVLAVLEQLARESEKIGLNPNNPQEGDNMKVIIGADHAGYHLKEEIVKFFEEENIDYEDIGTDSTESVDYPDYAAGVAKKVAAGEGRLGILICGTGIGMSIAANKFKGIRAAHCHDTVSARDTRRHNDSNVLTMGGRIIGPELAREIVRVWLEESFDGGRHQRRVDKIGKTE